MDPTKKLILELPLQTVQIIAAALKRMPWEIADPVLSEMQKQLDAQTNVVPINPERNDASA